jgi:pyroglutamyl-peptidase
MLNVLVTGFEPFGGSQVNPSEQVICALRQIKIPGVALTTVLLQVHRRQGPRELIHSVQTVSPDAVLCLGEAAGRAAISIERIAVNLLDFRIPDNAGEQVVDEPVIPGGPAAYFTSLPVRKIQKAMEEKKIPSELSHSAGTYLCNQVLYYLLHHIATESLKTIAGFIHLPALPQQAALRPVLIPSMSLETALLGIHTAIETIRTVYKNQDH